ncbi:DUF1810 domain-containing protein [Sphingomonas adhaesiva]|uniref:DUF1810 domain-containing protein n=1 Tax=Sphingomonas adhaesiva TaxID=28212 RepID=UPI002FF8F448
MTLDRFVAAQATTYDSALAELTAGRKRSHWMWFVFPQLAGLGHSATARHYAIHDLAEARAYLAHPLLGPRYRATAAALLPHRAAPPETIMGAIDAMKLRSSLTLFARAGAGGAVDEALAAFFPSPDAATLRLLDAD